MAIRLRRPFRNRRLRQGEPLRSRLHRRLSQRRRRRLTVINRYEVGMVAGDIATGLLFIAGSICLFYPETGRAPTVLYLIGSISMLLRSALRASYWFRFKSLNQEEQEAHAGGSGDWSR